MEFTQRWLCEDLRPQKLGPLLCGTRVPRDLPKPRTKEWPTRAMSHVSEGTAKASDAGPSSAS